MFGGPDDQYDIQRDDELLKTPKKEGTKMLDDEFFDRIEKLTEKLRNLRPDPSRINPPLKVDKKKNSYNNYFNYHAKPKNHSDNWRKIGE